MKKLFLLTSFFTITPILLILIFIYLSFLSFSNYHKTISSVFTHTKTVAYAALPSMQNIFENEISKKDARVELVRQFFARYNSPLEPYASDIVTAADANDLDFRLLPAIAMQESNLCKKAPKDSHNCWGFGIYGKNVRRFNNFPEAINIVSKTLAKDYLGKGLTSPEEIVSKYTPSDTGKWVNGVTFFMDKLQ